jgi:thiosulfate dehydrogenase [quinone] large subunit
MLLMPALYLLLRLYLGGIWLSQGLQKLREPRWMGSGEAPLAFWQRAVLIPEPPAEPPISFGWYRAGVRGLIRTGRHVPIARMLVVAQLVTGAALVLGYGTRAAALVGLLQNLGFSLAGGRAHNPFMLVGETILLCAASEPGHLGVDGLRRRR